MWKGSVSERDISLHAQAVKSGVPNQQWKSSVCLAECVEVECNEKIEKWVQ